MKNIKLILLCCALACVASFVGCKKSDGLNELSGTVTLDGQPLESGHIDIGPMAGQPGTATGGEIVNGAFKIRASAGDMVVSIRSQQTITITEDEQTADEKAHGVFERYEEIIPSRYNQQSELKCTVNPGKNTVAFDLVSDGSE